GRGRCPGALRAGGAEAGARRGSRGRGIDPRPPRGECLSRRDGATIDLRGDAARAGSDPGGGTGESLAGPVPHSAGGPVVARTLDGRRSATRLRDDRAVGAPLAPPLVRAPPGRPLDLLFRHDRTARLRVILPPVVARPRSGDGAHARPEAGAEGVV